MSTAPTCATSSSSEGDELVRSVRPGVLVLATAVAVLLFIACLNVANLLLARALSRSRELSIRAALGASRGRLARQCLTESAVLGLLGGAGGLVVAVAILAAFRRFATPLPRIDLGTTGVGWGSTLFPRLDEIGLDGTVLAVTAATAVAVGLAVGLGAALRASRADVFGAIRVSGATGAGGQRTGITRRALVVLQVAGATTLLVGAVLLTRSLRHLLDTDPGYATANLLTFQVALPTASYPDARLQTFAETMAERLRGVPGVVAAGYANQLPMVALRDTAGGLWTTPDAARRGKPDGEDARFVSRDYLAALGIRVLAGRGFTAGDGAGQPRVLLVNQALARRAFPERDPIGQTVYVGRDTAPWTIVGVVSDVRQFGLDRAPEPQFFADLRQWSGGMPLFPTGAYFAVKTLGRPEALVPDIRAVVRALDSDGALFNVARMDDIVASTVTRPRLYAVLIGSVRRPRRTVVGHRRLRPPGLPGRAAHRRIRDPHGARRLARRRARHGAAAGRRAGRRRTPHRPGRRRRTGPSARGSALRRHAVGPDGVCRRRGAVRGGRRRRRSAAGAPGDARRSTGRDPLRVAEPTGCCRPASSGACCWPGSSCAGGCSSA